MSRWLVAAVVAGDSSPVNVGQPVAAPAERFPVFELRITFENPTSASLNLCGPRFLDVFVGFAG